MAAARAIVGFDPFKSLPPQTLQRRPRLRMNQLLLERRKERFRHSIVVTRTRAAHRPTNVIRRAELREDPGRVLRAAVGMEDDATGRLTSPQRHRQRLGDQAGPHVRVQRPADQRAGVQVDHGGQVRPSVPRLDVRDVTAPPGVRFGRGEVPADQVRRRSRVVTGDGGDLPLLGVPSLQARGLHQPVHPLRRDATNDRCQMRPHPPHPWIAVQRQVRRDDLGRQRRILRRPRRRCPAPPGVVAGRGHTQLRAHEHHAVLTRISPVRDASENHCWPFANQVETFFENSSCISSFVFSVRSRASSVRSDSVSGFSAAGSPWGWIFFTHFLIDVSLISNFLATSPIVWPPSRINETASLLYSSVKLLRVEPICQSPVLRNCSNLVRCPPKRVRSSSAPSKPTRRPAIESWRNCRSTPASGSSKPSAWTWTTSNSPPAKAPCESSAKATRSAKSPSTHSSCLLYTSDAADE